MFPTSQQGIIAHVFKRCPVMVVLSAVAQVEPEARH